MILALLAGCSTATYATLDSTPSGARILVQGVDSGLRTPARLDLERYAADPDQPMAVQLTLDGYVPTSTTPYPPRHHCDRPFCEHAHRTTLPRTLPLLRDGRGVRVDVLKSGYDVALDDEPWRGVDGAALVPDAAAGLTLACEPGHHRLRWRRSEASERKGQPGSEVALDVGESGYVAVVLHRWPWGIPTEPRP